MPANGDYQWDAFISHASEDKNTFVEPLAIELKRHGLKVWFDKFTLRVGNSLRQSIDEGFAESRFGIVVLSSAFFSKNWPQKELNALFSRHVNGRAEILPVWHGLSKEEILKHSPLLSDIVAVDSGQGLPVVVRSLVEAIKPTLLQFDGTRQEAENAASRLREQLKDINPAIDSRIIFGPQELDAQKILSTQSVPGVLFSTAREGMRVEVFAHDPEAYKHRPISFNLRMTREALDGLLAAQNDGRQVELGPQDILGVAGDFCISLYPITR